MTANKLQEAITLIKSGDRQTGQQLLTEVLNVDPRNEAAWLWMSALMAGEKRRLCLEKVLSINPNHVQAREQLAKLMLSASPPAQAVVTAVAMEPPASRPSSSTSLPVTVQPAPASMPEVALVTSNGPVQGIPLPKVWLIPGKHLSSIIYFLENNLLTFDVLPDKAFEMLDEIRLGITREQFDGLKNKFHLMNVNHVLLNRVTSVTLFGDALTIIAVDSSGNEKKINATANKENSEAILKALHERLGPGFRRITRPISRLQVMGSALVLFLLTSCGTGFFYWFVQGLKADVEAAGGMGGSARARGMAALLLLIGPNGFLCIGGVLLVIVIIAMISSLSKPPEETVLTRVAASEKSQ